MDDINKKDNKSLEKYELRCQLCKGDTQFLGNKKVLLNKNTGLYFCNKCESLFRFPMPSEKDLYQFYESIPFIKPTGLSRYRLSRRLRKTKKQAMALKNLLINQGYNYDTSILDLGAGIGGLIKELNCCGFKNVYGIEGRQQARDCSMNEFGIKLEPGWIFDAHKIFPQAEVICISHVLEHLDKPWEVLDYLKKYYPGALLWIEVPNGELSSKKYSDVVLWNFWLTQHLWAYSRKGLKSLFNQYDISLIEIATGRHYPMYEWIREFEFLFARSLFKHGKNVALSIKGMLAIILRIIFIYLPIKLYKYLVQRIPFISLPDEPFYLRVSGKIPSSKD
tara:strand:- start:757 stop:1761 length:1005 start_codon:yes stop_codon:yes gene_type:complete